MSTAPPLSAPTIPTTTTEPIDQATPTSLTTMSPVSVSRAEEATSPQIASDPSDPNNVRELVRKQLEYYFSRGNLSRDAYLVSKMNADKYVSIAEISSFPKLHRLSQDVNLIASVMQESPVMHVDRTGTMVRPTSIGAQRNTLMLRELSSDIPEADIRALFGDTESSISSCRADVGDTWFVKFDTEDDCLAAAVALGDANYKGKPIRRRVKSENLLRTSYAPAAAGLGGDPAGSVGGIGVGAGAGGYPGGYSAQPFPGYNPYLYQPMYSGQMMGNPYAPFYPGAQQHYTPYGQQGMPQPNANLAPLHAQTPNAKDSTDATASFSLQQQPTPRARGSYNNNSGGSRGNYRSGAGRGGRHGRHNQNNYNNQQGPNASYQTRTTSFRQVNNNGSQVSSAGANYQQQPSLFQQVGNGANTGGVNGEAAPATDNILSRLMNPSPQSNGQTGGRPQQQRAFGGARRNGVKSKQHGDGAVNEVVMPQTAADPDDHNEFPALSAAHTTYSQPQISHSEDATGATDHQAGSGQADSTTAQQKDHRPPVKYSMSQMKSFIDNLKNEQLPLPEEYRATLTNLAPKTIHPLIRVNPRKLLTALSQPPAIMTPESPFTAVAQVPCDLPALSIGEADTRGAAPSANHNRTLQGHQHKQPHHAFSSHAQHAYSTSPSSHYQPPHGHAVGSNSQGAFSSHSHSTRQQTHFRSASGGQTNQQKPSPQANSLLSALANKGSSTESTASNNVPDVATASSSSKDTNAADAQSNHVGDQKPASSPEQKDTESSPGAPPREGGNDSVNQTSSQPLSEQSTSGKAMSAVEETEAPTPSDVVNDAAASGDSSTAVRTDSK